MLAVTGGKGGCGKTTTTLGLAAAFARQRRRPVAVDADRDMPNLAIVANAVKLPGVAVVPNPEGRRLSDLRLPSGGEPVLVDCPAGSGPDTADPLRRADRALVVTTDSRQSVEDALKTVAMARSLGTPVAGVVVSRRDDPPDGLAEAADAPVLACVPSVEKPLSTPASVAAHDELASRLGPNA